MNQEELYKSLSTTKPQIPVLETKPNPEPIVEKEITEEEAGIALDNIIAKAYKEYEELPPAQQFIAAVAPGTGEAISAYETKKFFEETKEAIKEGKFGEAALKGGLTALAGLGTIPLAGKGIQVAKAAAKRLPELTSIKNIKKILKQNNKPATEMNINKIADEIGESKEYINPDFIPKGQEPKNSVIGYKVFKKKADGNIYPLYIDTKNPIPINQWMKANKGFYFKDSKGIKRQPAETGNYQPIPDKKTAEAIEKAGYKVTKTEKAIADAGKGLSKKPFAARMSVKYRPGWHGDTFPNASHLSKPGSKTGEGAKRVWAEVEFSNDKDYTDIVNQRGINPETGKFNSKEADIDYVPEGGSYRYKTNPNMEGAWLIGGEMKVNRVLDVKEVNQIKKDLKKRGTK